VLAFFGLYFSASLYFKLFLVVQDLYPVLEILKNMRVGKRAKKAEDLVTDLRNKNPCEESDITLLKKCVGSWLMYHCNE